MQKYFKAFCRKSKLESLLLFNLLLVSKLGAFIKSECINLLYNNQVYFKYEIENVDCVLEKYNKQGEIEKVLYFTSCYELFKTEQNPTGHKS